MSKILSALAKVMEFVAKNSTTILTGSTIVGIGGAAVTSWYAAKKTCDIRQMLGEDATKAEVAKQAWPYYVAPTIFVGIAVGSVVLLNAKHNEKYAALLGAYTVAKADKEKLGKKVKELVGEEKANQIKESLGIKTDEEKKDEKDIQNERKRVEKVEEIDAHDVTWIIDGETGMRFLTSKVAVMTAGDLVNQTIAQAPDDPQTVEDLYNHLGVTDDEMPDMTQCMYFQIGERVPSLNITWGSITDRNLHTYPAFFYDFNVDRTDVRSYHRNQGGCGHIY